jgi:hypothetical protein
MIIVCCGLNHKGPRVLGEKEPLADLSETHTYCPACLDIEYRRFNLTRSKGEKPYVKSDPNPDRT